MEKNKAQAQAQQTQAQQTQAQQTQAQQQAQQTQAQQQQAQVKAKAPVQTRKNGFSILEALMEEEEATAERLANEKIEAAQKVIAHQQAFPTIGKAKPVAHAPGVSWATLAAKPKAQAQAPAKQAQTQAPTQAQQAKAQAQVVDAPYDDEDPEMLKHFRKTVTVLFQEKDAEIEKEIDRIYTCGYSWADELE
jgi:hypothetical protein